MILSILYYVDLWPSWEVNSCNGCIICVQYLFLCWIIQLDRDIYDK